MFLNKFGLSLNLDLNLFLKGKSSPRLGPKPSRPTLPHSPFGRHLSSFTRRPAHPSPHVSAAGVDVVLNCSAPRAGCLNNSASLPSSPPIAASLEAKDDELARAFNPRDKRFGATRQAERLTMSSTSAAQPLLLSPSAE